MTNTIYFPSKDSENECDEAINSLVDFVVVVPENHKLKEAVLQDLPLKLGQRQSGYSQFRNAVNTFKLMASYSGLAGALDRKHYKVSYEDKGDLHIFFEAKGNSV